MSTTRRPNILFLFPDQWRFDFTCFNDEAPIRTPCLESLARRGVRFTNAVTPSPLCAPARACLAMGLEYDRCPVKGNGDNTPLDAETFYRLLRESGYHVTGCGKFDLAKASSDWGLDGKNHLREWGFSDGVDNEGKWDAINSGKEKPAGPYMHALEQRGQREAHLRDFLEPRRRSYDVHATPLPDDLYCDNWLTDNGLGLLDETPRDRPWFLQVNFTGPHDPWDVTKQMKQWYADATFPQPTDPHPGGSAEQHQEVRRNYAAMCENIDRQCQRLIDKVAERGELENTLIVFSSDHGEMLGDRQGWGKAKPWQPSVGVPLVMAGAGVAAEGAVNDKPTTILDLAATFLDAAGLGVPDAFDSRSLKPVMTSGEGGRDVVRSGLKDWRLAFDGRWKLIRDETGDEPPQLYDLAEDPWEQRNVYGDQAETAKRLAEAMAQGG